MHITARKETWPIAGEFRISRGAKTRADIVLVEIEQDGFIGRGECVPYARFGETVEGVLQTIRSFARPAARRDRPALQTSMRAGAARNALDCALWDLASKTEKSPVWRMAGLPEPGPANTCFTVSLDTPDNMRNAARAAQHWPVLKVKLNGNQIHERLTAIHEGAPDAKIVIDANESLSVNQLDSVLAFPSQNIVLIEQPLPAGHDGVLENMQSPIPLCADESAHDTQSLAALDGKYQAVNIKLDKTGGLTEALSMAKRAREMGLNIMVGCMVGTSLGMAPAMMLSDLADVADLDGPLLLARDRQPALQYAAGMIFPPSPQLWG